MQYDEFIEQVQARSRTTDRREAERLTEIVLTTLTEPLSREITNRLSSQLPKELKQLVEKHHTDPLQTMKQYGLEEFYNRVKSRLDVTYSEGVRMAQAVAGVLAQAVGDGLLDEVRRDLPDEYRELLRRQGSSGGTERQA